MKKIMSYYILMFVSLSLCLFVSNIGISLLLSMIGILFIYLTKRNVKDVSVDINENEASLYLNIINTSIFLFILFSILQLVFNSHEVPISSQYESLLGDIDNSALSTFVNNMQLFTNLFNIICLGSMIGYEYFKLRKKLKILKENARLNSLLKTRIGKKLLIKHNINLSNGIVLKKNSKIKLNSYENNIWEFDYYNDNNSQTLSSKGNIDDIKELCFGIP